MKKENLIVIVAVLAAGVAFSAACAQTSANTSKTATSAKTTVSARKQSTKKNDIAELVEGEIKLSEESAIKQVSDEIDIANDKPAQIDEDFSTQ